ncbi:exodeoxyribonuclease V subunit gamma [Caballeronia sordidicola]|uniref:RecBCD enzyme subunit RecC n=1 Tax=Caballeronia sordidicola TaxID=196367 RepID=A0A158EVZ5_CABSO|nr:exodeoxyribonuclease V subunit gamma [Caballeronia sordidicola]SAL11698.1 exodeoxyribonuclease V subunit gamma [Caballeronia sordidicola]
MLELFYSNRHETLSQALLDDVAAFALNDGDPFASQTVIVPSAAVRRRLELDMATRFGICANVDLCYLAQWLWARIGGVLPVPEHSPFAPDRLVWRCFRLLGAMAEAAPERSSRLHAYLDAADDSMRYELARRIATVFDHYLTYRPEWLLHWQAGGSILAAAGGALEANGPRLPNASAIQREDERWQAELWRALLADLAQDTGARDPTPPAYKFLTESPKLDLDAVMKAEWPERVSVFALPTMPPLHIALLRELSRWIDVRVYAINPCREFWFDIVSEARVEQLELAGKLDFQQVGHPLLAEWGRQTQAQLHMLHELTESAASREASHFEHNATPTWLAHVQNAILDLGEPAAPDHALEPGIEIHVCHSLSRQLEVLHDRLLGWFDQIEGLQPSDVLVAFPDLAAAGPLIDGVFGTSPAGAAGERRRIPYRITGLPPSQANPVARVLLEWLALPERSVGAPELIEWLRVDAVAARYGIDSVALETAQTWLAAAGARRGLAPSAVSGADVPAARHTFSDALTRLFLGYALPDGGAPVDEWLPVEGANGSDSELLGRLTRFIDDIDAFAESVAISRTPSAWTQTLLEALTQFFDAGLPFADSVADVRATLDSLMLSMNEGAAETEISADVLRTALADALDDAARGGVPWGGVTFSSLTSLRGLPYRVICLLGMDDGMLPSLARADEFDLMASFGKLGDRQRRDDERNLFLDLLLSARDRLMIAYTGRSIRDNATLPPAALIDELLDHLAETVAGKSASPKELEAARRRFVFEHPLQPFAPEYFSAPLFTYEPERAELARTLALGRTEPAVRFFSVPLPPEDAEPIAFDDFERFWRHPARAILRDRLGIALFDAETELGDTEPFELEYPGRSALADRVLPSLLALTPDGESRALERARRVARASPEMPGGATGGVWQSREIGALHSLANRVRIATGEGAARLPYSLDIKPRWPNAELFGRHDSALQADALQPIQLHGTLNLLTDEGQIIYRYDVPRARDYLSAWLAHLAYCAVLPDGPRRTVWHGRGAQSSGFELTPVADPCSHLATLTALYRAGRRLPLRFFPKTAWTWVAESESKAQGVWISDRTRGESDDPALRIAFRGAELRLDETFATLARVVFEPLMQHVRSEA